jgi:arabinogalactan oligomer/maltooligosaccharide transport system permease protein
LSAGETDIAVVGAARRASATLVAKARVPSGRPKLRDTWWRHIVAILATLIALFPIVFVISASFNATNSISSEVIPAHVTMHNFGNLLHNNVCTPGQGCANAPYVHWIINSMIVAGATAFFTTLLGALAAYAFSRFRFKGRRMGMMTLLLIQMFPQFGAIAAIYLLILNVGNIFHPIGINTLLGVVVVYLGGAMGVQAWLMKGFFDTIPAELDESARVDGATPAQIFWGVVLPLAAPVLVVVALISFVFTLNEFVIASALLQTTTQKTLPVGMQGFISDQYGQRWGPFAAGSLMAMVPVVALFLFLQRWIVSGLTAGSVKG